MNPNSAAEGALANPNTGVSSNPAEATKAPGRNMFKKFGKPLGAVAGAVGIEFKNQNNSAAVLEKPQPEAVSDTERAQPPVIETPQAMEKPESGNSKPVSDHAAPVEKVKEFYNPPKTEDNSPVAETQPLSAKQEPEAASASPVSEMLSGSASAPQPPTVEVQPQQTQEEVQSSQISDPESTEKESKVDPEATQLFYSERGRYLEKVNGITVFKKELFEKDMFKKEIDKNPELAKQLQDAGIELP